MTVTNPNALGLANPRAAPYLATLDGVTDDTAAFKRLHEAINAGTIGGYYVPKTAAIKSGNLPVITKECEIRFFNAAKLDFSENLTATRGISIEGSEGASAELTGNAAEGAYTLEVATEYADGAILKLMDPTTVWDPQGTATHPGEFVEVGQPDGFLSGINGATNSAGGLPAGTKVTALAVTNLNPRSAAEPIWPTTGTLQIGAETFTYTSRTFEGNFVKFVITEKECLTTFAQGFRVRLANEAGKVYLRIPVSGEGGYTTANKSKVALCTMVPRVTIDNARIQGPLFPAGGGVGMVGINVALGMRANIVKPYIDTCLNTGVRFEGCMWSHIDDPFITNARQLNFTTGGSSYGVNFNRGTQDCSVRGGRTIRTRHSFTYGAGGDALARRNVVMDHQSISTFADAYDTHGSGDGIRFLRCIALEPYSAGFNMNNPKASAKDCEVYRPGTSGVQCANQTIGKTDYDMDVSVYGSVGAGIVIGPAAYRKIEKIKTTLNSTTVTSEAGKKVFKATDLGSAITGTGIPAGATITKVTTEEEITISAEATATGEVTVAIGIGQNQRRIRIRGAVDSSAKGAVSVTGAGEGNAIAWYAENVDIDVQVSNGPTTGATNPAIQVAAAKGVRVRGQTAGVQKGNHQIELRDVQQFLVDLGPLGWAEASTGFGVNVIVGTGGAAGGTTKGVIREGPMFNRGKESTKLDNNVTNVWVYPGPDETVVLGTGAGNQKVTVP